MNAKPPEKSNIIIILCDNNKCINMLIDKEILLNHSDLNLFHFYPSNQYSFYVNNLKVATKLFDSLFDNDIKFDYDNMDDLCDLLLCKRQFGLKINLDDIKIPTNQFDRFINLVYYHRLFDKSTEKIVSMNIPIDQDIFASELFEKWRIRHIRIGSNYY